MIQMHTRFALKAGLVTVAAMAVLAACKGEEEKPACCAIEPKSKCEGDLLGSDVSRSEVALLMGASDMVCPSGELSETRIRELKKIWDGSDSCKQSRGYGRLDALDAGMCSVRSVADAPPLPPGVDQAVATTCATGLVARGIRENELWLVLGAPEKVCPAVDISEERIRDIIERDWALSGCTQFSAEEMLKALNSGTCATPAP